MKLMYNEFEILVCIEKENRELSQREIAKMTNLSLGTVNKTITSLIDNKLINENNTITKKGLKELEPYRVKRAIFLAAGFGSRLVPITLNTPKPLVLVNGKKIIETLLDAVIKAEIPEIIIVTGYLNEQFEILLKKYPNIKFVYNEKYNEANNISSAYLVRDKFDNSYVLESDLYLYNQDLIRKYEYHSNFLGFKVDRSDDWCLETKNGVITKEKVGGVNCYQMCGISYYDKETGKQMEKDIKEVFMSPGGKEKYWEQVMLEVKKNDYKIYLRECNREDIIEIDTFNELKAIDKAILQTVQGLNPEEYTVLNSIPGIGKVYSAGILAEIGSIKAFQNANQLAKYCGIVWNDNDSGDFESEDSRMSKAGNRYLRYYIIEATGSVINHCPEYKAFYQKKYAETRNHQHKRALALTSRKFIRLLFGLLDKGQLYSPEKSR